VFLFLYLPLFAIFVDILSADFEQYRLDKAVELSVRAATQNGLEYGNVVFDHGNLVDVRFNERVVLDTFAKFMCFNYGIVPTQMNMDHVLGRSVLMAVNGSGFHVTQNEIGNFYMGNDGIVYRVRGAVNPNQPGNHQPIFNAGSRTVFGPFIPFMLQDVNAPAGVTRIVSGSILPGASDFVIFEHRDGTGNFGATRVSTLPGGLTLSRVQHEALAMMTRALTASWNNLNVQTYSDTQLVLPDTITNLGVSSAAQPGVLALVEGMDVVTTRRLRSDAFTGFAVILRRDIVAFRHTVNGVVYHWYAYRDQLDMSRMLADDAISVDFVFETMVEAVLRGYQPHLGYLVR
jgi:hypothetical protein